MVAFSGEFLPDVSKSCGCVLFLRVNYTNTPVARKKLLNLKQQTNTITKTHRMSLLDVSFLHCLICNVIHLQYMRHFGYFGVLIDQFIFRCCSE